MLFIINRHILPPWSLHASCHERNKRRNEAKLKLKKFTPLQTPAINSYHTLIAVATYNFAILSKLGVHPSATPQAFHFTNPCYSLLSHTIFIACFTSKPFFFFFFFFFNHTFTILPLLSLSSDYLHNSPHIHS